MTATSSLALCLAVACSAPRAARDQASPPSEDKPVAASVEGCVEELPVTRVAHPGAAAEAYFSPDGQSLICNAKLEDDQAYYVYTMRRDGSALRRINDRGEDACSYYFPDGQRLIWTSTRDHLDLAPGAFSNPDDYPSGAELYASALDGDELRRLTDNQHYDAEVSVSPDGRWILFTRQVEGALDLWRMRVDGSDEQQITNTPDWQEGGAFYLPDSETIVYRAWRTDHQRPRGIPMTLFTIKHDGTALTRLTHDGGTNWAPYPAPDGRHLVFVRHLPSHNFEIYLLDMQSGAQRRLTCDPAFDGFPSLSPDGKTLAFSSSRGAAPGSRSLTLFLMDVSSLGLGPRP